MLLALAVAATIEAQKSGGNGEQGTGSGEQETAGGDDPIEPPRSGGVEVTNLCFTSISVASNEATLGVSWPLGFIETGSKIDLFAFTSLDAFEQTWLSAHVVAAAETNWMPTVDTSCLASGTDAYPPMLFFSAAVRADPGDLRDTDGDSIPDSYEMRNDGNPYVPDYDDVSKLVVRPSGLHPTIASALEASRDYSIIELDPAFVHDVADAVHVPAHPVMFCSPPGTCAVVRATQFAAFLLDTNVTSRTLFKNLYVLLDARSSYQAAFFVGGSVPWNPVAASATFEDIYVRMPNSGVEYFGWLFYANGTDTARMSGCTINAAGSEWAYGMQAFGSPPLSVENCSFVNFPPNLGGTHASCGMLLRSSPGIGGGADVSVTRSLFDESFTNAVMFGRLEGGTSNVLSVADCIAPRDPEEDYPLDEVSGLVLTNAALAWAGFPWPDSPSVALGVGSLSPIANDPTADSDDDGLYDYHEVYDLGTDPFLADTDRDGIADGDEIGQGTDPSDPHSFLQNLTVSVTNTVSLSHAAYVAYGNSSDTWETNGLASFPSAFGSTLYTNASAQAATRVKAFCDLDDDGEFSATTDILISKTIPQSPAAHITFSFGDVDGDGVNDEQERTDGTNPYDGGNFHLRDVTVSFTDVDSGHGYTNVVAISPLRDGWNADEIVASFSSATFSYDVDTVVTGGVVYVKCLRDLDGDGELDVGVEQIVVTRLTLASRGKTENVAVGDYDGDGIADMQELQDGTDPYDKNNYAINLFGCFTNVFQTTNVLSVVLQTSSEMLYGPILLTNGTTWTFSSNHVEVTDGGRPYFVFWDDADSNEVHEVSEASVTYMPSPFSHDMVFTNRLSYGSFDKDYDGMLDWWELQYGLSPTNELDAFLDEDGDGILNIQEYELGLNPLISAGTNNLFYVLNRSLDDRIEGLSPTNTRALYYNIMENGPSTNFIPNVQSWLSGVDLSCCAIWSEYASGTTGPYGNTAARITLVGPRHVVYARHFDYRDEMLGETMPTNKVYFFRGKSGAVYGRCVVKKDNSIGGDIGIGLLNETLPTNDVTPAIYFPMEFDIYLGKGHLLPYFFVDENIDTYVVTWDGITSANRTEPVYGRQKNIANRSAFWKQGGVWSGSSSPQFMLVGNQPVLIGTLWRQYGGNPGSVFASLFKIEIETKFRKLDNTSTFQLKTLDLSGFQTLQEME